MRTLAWISCSVAFVAAVAAVWIFIAAGGADRLDVWDKGASVGSGLIGIASLTIGIVSLRIAQRDSGSSKMDHLSETSKNNKLASNSTQTAHQTHSVGVIAGRSSAINTNIVQNFVQQSAHTDPEIAVWNIPARLSHFIGREDTLAAVRATLVADGPIVVQSIHGMAGVGKTTIAIEYAHRFSTEYDIAWWIPSEAPELIQESLSSLATALRISGPTDDVGITLARLHGELQRQERWLLIFDNADDPSILTRFLPPNSGHVLITSRSPEWGSLSSASLKIGEFTRQESISLLGDRITGLSSSDANAVAAAIGDLPLVIDQAAGLLAESSITTEKYLNLLSVRTAELLTKGQSTGYPDSVTTSWSIAFQRVAEEDESAIQILHLLARLSPEPVPLSLLTSNCSILPEPLATTCSDPIELDSTLKMLRRRAMAIVDGNSITLHRIPAALLRSTLMNTEDGSEIWEEAAIRLLYSAIPKHPWFRPKTWPEWVQLLPHVLVATSDDRKVDSAFFEASKILLIAGTFLLTRDEAESGHGLIRRAHATLLNKLGPEHRETLGSASYLASSMWAMGDHASAVSIGTNTLKKYRELFGDDDPDTLAAASNLAIDLKKIGQVEESLALSEDAYTRRRRVLGADDSGTLISAHNHASSLVGVDRRSEALDLAQETFERRRRTLGPNDLFTLSTSAMVARLLAGVGRKQEAIEIAKDNLARYRALLGDTHTETTTADNLLKIIENSEDPTSPILDLLANQQFEKAAEICESRIQGAPGNGNLLNNFGFCLVPIDPLGALEVLNRALREGYDQIDINSHNQAVCRYLLGNPAATLEIVSDIWPQLTSSRALALWRPTRCGLKLSTDISIKAEYAFLAYTAAKRKLDRTAMETWSSAYLNEL